MTGATSARRVMGSIGKGVRVTQTATVVLVIPIPISAAHHRSPPRCPSRLMQMARWIGQGSSRVNLLLPPN